MENQESTRVGSEEQRTSGRVNARLGDVFSLFCSKDKLRPALHYPFIMNGKVYATDANTLIFIDERECDFEVPGDRGYTVPNVEKVIPAENKRQIINISQADFDPFKNEDEVEYIGNDVVCSTCDGEGEVEWTFERWEREFECPACYGSGLAYKALEVKTGKKTFGRQCVKLGEAIFDMHLFYKLIQVQKEVGGDIVLLYSDKPNAGHLFDVGICKVLIMPLNSPYEDAEILNVA